MPTSLTRFPDLPTLSRGLSSVFSSNAYTARVTVLERQPNICASTFPSEIVTCCVNDGTQLRLFCKYGAEPGDDVYGHRRGVAYEACVHRHVLQPSQLSTPRFYGAYTDTTTGETWLVIEYLDRGVWVDKELEPGAMGVAARWLGQFHAVNETRLLSEPMPFLSGYDAAYYLGWARRTSLFAKGLRQRFPWLDHLCASFAEVTPYLLGPTSTVIHGEFYPHNILIRDGALYPVDWESAAVAAGEIDLASLTEDWSPEIVREIELEYQRARWPDGAPAGLERTLEVARLYIQFRWLGDRAEWTTDERGLQRFAHLRAAGERLGLI